MKKFSIQKQYLFLLCNNFFNAIFYYRISKILYCVSAFNIYVFELKNLLLSNIE